MIGLMTAVILTIMITLTLEFGLFVLARFPILIELIYLRLRLIVIQVRIWFFTLAVWITKPD